MSTAIIAAIVAIVVCAVEGLLGLIKLLINKFSEKDKNYLSEEQTMMLKVLFDLHSRYDTAGVPLWYVPRSWDETQKEIVEKLYRIGETQNKTLDIIERLERRLETFKKNPIGGLK